MHDRPTLTITCIGTRNKRHPSLDVKTYHRDDDGTWMPIHSGTRTNSRGEQINYLSPGTGMIADTSQFELSCPNPRCPFVFRHPSLKVATILNDTVAAGEHEIPLLALDIALQRRLAED
jgi:hypothetical protein